LQTDKETVQDTRYCTTFFK